MSLAFCWLVTVGLQPGRLAADPTTALDDYIAAPDASFAWSQVNTILGPGYEADVLDMTSQTWRTLADVTTPDWQHYVTVIRPANLTSHRALLYIDGGSNGGGTPGSADSTLIQLAQATGSIVIDLKEVPNEPLTFTGQPPRSEDAIIAYTWEQYLNTGDETWPAQLPMTKSAVKAMDAVQAFAASPAGGSWSIDDFVVSGGSKRGWTTWLTAAVDDRVKAIIPAVIDTLNVEQSFQHHHDAYGFWAPAVDDYVAAGVMDALGTPAMDNLMRIVDPYSYLDRLTMPKYIVNSAGDQFFLPDSSQFYFNDLQGVKYLRYVPNSDHSLDGTDAAATMGAFYDAILHNRALPQFSWTKDASGTLHLHTDSPVLEVKLWEATNHDARDFRLETIGAAYTTGKDLINLGNGDYVSDVAIPAEGWTAFFIEMTYSSGSLLGPYKFTTEVSVVGVPEPGSWALLIAGAFCLALAGGYRRRGR